MHVCYQSIVNGIILVKDSVINDLDILEGSVGDEYLDEDELMRQIEAYKALRQQLELTAEHAETVKARLEREGHSNLASNVNGTIGRCKSAIAELNEQIDALQEKIIFLHEVEDSTVNLFESAIDLIETVECAINDGGGSDMVEELRTSSRFKDIYPKWMEETTDLNPEDRSKAASDNLFSIFVFRDKFIEREQMEKIYSGAELVIPISVLSKQLLSQS